MLRKARHIEGIGQKNKEKATGLDEEGTAIHKSLLHD